MFGSFVSNVCSNLDGRHGCGMQNAEDISEVVVFEV
jgi:hypothetical protein